MVLIENEATLTREKLFEVLSTNPGIIIIKFEADWCRPCKLADMYIKKRLETLNDQVSYISTDVDDSFDLYAFLKSKKMVNGIPAVLAYIKGNTEYVSDFCVMGADENEINAFFNQVESTLQN